MPGLCLGYLPNGQGGAGLSVLPPMGREPATGADGAGAAAGGAAGGGTVAVPPPLMPPMKPPRGSHVLDCNGLLEATRLAAPPMASTVSEDAAVRAGAAIGADGESTRCRSGNGSTWSGRRFIRNELVERREEDT